MYSLREEAEIGGLDFAFKGQQNDDELQDQKEVDDEANLNQNLQSNARNNRDRDHSTASNIVRQLAAKAAKTATELSPLNQLANMRQVHRENRDLRDEVHYQTNTSSPSFKTRVARIIEVASGRAALVGLVAAPFSEIVYRQSILSQLLGRWEGVRHVEYAIPSARMLAEAVVIASLTFTVVEALVGQGLPPSSKWPFTRLSPFLQLWVGRVAAIGFAALLLFEVQQSNRPAFFWFLHP